MGRVYHTFVHHTVSLPTGHPQCAPAGVSHRPSPLPALHSCQEIEGWPRTQLWVRQTWLQMPAQLQMPDGRLDPFRLSVLVCQAVPVPPAVGQDSARRSHGNGWRLCRAVLTGTLTRSLLFWAQVEKENFVIQELKNHLHQVLKFSENSLLRTEQEAEKQQKTDYRASQTRVAKIQQDILQLRSQFHSLVMENREAEQALRKVPWGATGQGTGCWGSSVEGRAAPATRKPRVEPVSPGRQEGAARGPGGRDGPVLLPHAPSVILGRLPRSPEPRGDDETHLSIPYDGTKRACTPQAITEPWFSHL